MDVVLEFITLFVGAGIYGTDASPRHPIWRNMIRLIAFGGAAIAFADMVSLLGDTRIPTPATAFWLFCSVIVLSAEYYLGSKRVALASIVVLALLIGTAFATLDIFG